MKVGCRNCGEIINVPDSEPRHTHIHLGFSKLWDNLFTPPGILIVFFVCAIGFPALVGIFHHDSDAEYEAIKKAIETPGIRVEVSKENGKIGWKILKDPEPEKKK